MSMDRLASRDWVLVSLSGSGASLVEIETRAWGGGMSSEFGGVTKRITIPGQNVAPAPVSEHRKHKYRSWRTWRVLRKRKLCYDDDKARRVFIFNCQALLPVTIDLIPNQ